MSTLASDLALGLSVAASWSGLFYCFIGVFLSTFIGVLPGIDIMATPGDHRQCGSDDPAQG